jgi:hypothetical protein
MGTRYTVKKGDSLSRIAARHGLPSWRIVYNSPENAVFRRRRPNPNLIQPGDELILPDLPGNSLPVGRLSLPWDFASKLELPQTVYLDPIPRPSLFTVGLQLFPPLNPAFNFGSPASPGSSATWGGPVYDNPITANGEPVHGGYGEALKWTGKALLKYPWVNQQLDGLKDRAVDFAWRSAPGWQKGLEIGVGLGGGALLLSLKPSRDFILEKLVGVDIPILKPFGVDWLSVQPKAGIDFPWGGGVINVDVQHFLKTENKKKE